ncbi:MAG TPA: CBS domain-containing protein [Thermohalobaculum sp.]|nr:CBS domain-containing protein [Thermohalobaculum sp.]
MIVKHILKLKGSTSIETIAPGALVAEAAARLDKRRIGALVVSETGSDIAGILSERDIVRALARKGGGCLNMKVSELMTAEVESCAPGENANSVLERMTQGRFRHMPVVEDGRMIGLVSIGDVVKTRISEIEQENQAMANLLGG